MRGLCLLAGVLLLAGMGGGWAAATSPKPPWEANLSLDGPPIVGRPVALSVRLDTDVALRTTLDLHIPAWVDAGVRTWDVDLPPGGRAETRFQLTPRQAGFWIAGLAMRPSSENGWGGGACCVYAFSAADEGRWSARALEDAVPPVALDVEVARARDAMDARVRYTVAPAADWLRHATIRVAAASWVSEGNASFMTATQSEGPADRTREVVRPVVVRRDGGGLATTTTAELSTEVIVSFDGGPGHPGAEWRTTGDCRVVGWQVFRSGAVRDAEWRCDDGPPPLMVPAAGAPLVLAAAGAAAAVLARRRR